MTRLRSRAPQPDQAPLRDDPALIEALALSAASGRLSNEDVRAMRAARRRTAATLGAVAAFLAIGAGGIGWLRPAPAPVVIARHFETRRGEMRDVKLADGSRLRLNGATRLDVELHGDRRDATLLAGEAYFDIAHDPARPFTVHAGGSRVQVLGTAFDIDMVRSQVGLSVYRGAVRFAPVRQPAAGVTVRAGWRSHFRDGTAAQPLAFDPAQQDWREGWLDTNGMKLGDLVDTLNRQGGPVVSAPPPALADMPVAGRFRVDNPQQLLSAIGGAYGFTVKRSVDRIELQP